MLNIPAEIQALYKTDSVRKNFRVHFPNGESPDLTNSDIVAGSVSFTESVCSKDVLQFGLAEASRIEFECVNVPNIYGAVIECYNEIDATDADAQYQTTMPDLDYPVYQIPLGVFTVSSCPRSAGAMWKRRVEAYSSDKVHDRSISDFLSDKLAWRIPTATSKQNAHLLVAGEVNSTLGLAFTESTISLTYTSQTTQTLNEWTYNGDTYTVITNTTGHYSSGDLTDFNALYRFTSNADMTQLNAMYKDLTENYGMNNEWFHEVRKTTEAGISYGLALGAVFADSKDSGYVYPYLELSQGSTITVVYPSATFTVELQKNYQTLKTYTISDYISSATLKKYTLTNPDETVPMNLTYTGTLTNNSITYYSYIGAVDLPAIAEGVSELTGQFMKTKRDGSAEIFSLSKSSPVAMSTDEYSSLWWDEYDISPIGSIEITYKDIDLKQEQTIIYEFGTGASTYDMTNNYLLKNLAVSANDLNNQTVEEYVTGLLDTYFIPNITDIAFTPVQLSSLGLPYLEAGDYLEIDDGNGGTVGTYIMSRTLSGVQFLEDDIESKGGEIIGNVRSA